MIQADLQTLKTLKRYRGDFSAFCRNMVTIRDKDGRMVKLEPNRAQRAIFANIEEQIEERGYSRSAILKARQTGSSTGLAARVFWHSLMRTNGVQSLTFAHVDETAQRLCSMVKTAYDGMMSQMRHPITRLNAHEIAYDDSLMQFYTGGRTAGERGRGSTLDIVWLSEVCFMDAVQDILHGALRAVPEGKGEVYFESTAKGGPVGPWWQFWSATQRGDNDFRGIFVPWFWADEYQSPVEGGMTYSREAPCDGILSEYDYQQLHQLTPEQMMFRRRAIADMSAMGAQGAITFSWEYPATPEEAFLGGSTEGFIQAAPVLRALKHNIHLVDVRSLPLLMGVDPAQGGPSATAIIKRRGPKAFDLERHHQIRQNELITMVSEVAIREHVGWLYIDASEPYGMVIADRLSNIAALAGRVIGVRFGDRPDNAIKFANRRAEMWFRIAQWLEGAVDIPDEVPSTGSTVTLMSELLAPRLRNTELKHMLESKEQMRARGVPSPDGADALAMTFYHQFEMVGPSQHFTAPVEMDLGFESDFHSDVGGYTAPVDIQW